MVAEIAHSMLDKIIRNINSFILTPLTMQTLQNNDTKDIS